MAAWKMKAMLSFVFQTHSCSQDINRDAPAAEPHSPLEQHQRLIASAGSSSVNRQSINMDTEWTASLWLDTFNELLNEDNELDYGDRWTLNFNYNQTDRVTEEERRRGWKVSTYCARGNFECASCTRTWASARVVLVFRYRLLRGQGTVIMRPFGQACLRCRGNNFNLPGFAEKEVEQALLRQFYKIRKNCYHEEDDDEDSGRSSSEPEAKTKPHEKNLCQACRMGICCVDDEDDD
uniref:Receptor-transporting protein 4 n=2 Tax=Oreochromis niloticus TaxID=8128 RepID=A0A669F3D8_ORENI